MTGSLERKLLIVNWAFVACLALVLVIFVSATDFEIRGSGLRFMIGAGLALILSPASILVLRAGSPRRPLLLHAGVGLCQLISAIIVILPLSYIAASAGYPLQDEMLYAFDRLVGLEWGSFLRFADDHHLGLVLTIGYSMIQWPLFLAPTVLCLSGCVRRSYELVLTYLLAAAMVVIISTFVPAVAAYSYLGLSPEDYPNVNLTVAILHTQHLGGVRDGTLRVLEMSQLTGIVQFPSFHAALGIIYVWALWPVWWIRPIALLSNGLLLISTPIDGGHYFIDVFAGIGTAILCIAAVRAFSRAIERDRPSVEARDPIGRRNLSGTSS